MTTAPPPLHTPSGNSLTPCPPRPLGRLLRDCQRAFSDLRAAPPPSPYPLDPRTDPAMLYQARPSYQEAASSIGRSIVPRPQGMPPSMYPPATPYASPAGAEPPRKRGRPSNADLEARRQRAEARGEPYPQPPRPKGKGKVLSLPPGATQPPTPVQSDPPTAGTASATSPNQASFMQNPPPPRLHTASASPAPLLSHPTDSSKRPRPPDTPTEEPAHELTESRRPDAPPSRAPRFPAADVFSQPWNAPSPSQAASYPQRSMAPTHPPLPLAAPARGQEEFPTAPPPPPPPPPPHSYSSGRMSPPNPRERR